MSEKNKDKFTLKEISQYGFSKGMVQGMEMMRKWDVVAERGLRKLKEFFKGGD